MGHSVSRGVSALTRRRINWFDLVLVESKIIRCPEESYNCQDVQDDYADAIAYAESYTIDSEEVVDEWYDWDEPELHYHEAPLAVHEMAAQTLQAWNRGPARALIRIERDIHRVRLWQDVTLVTFIVTAALVLVLWTR